MLGEAGSGPPVTRSDWVIVDASSAIYISAHSEAQVDISSTNLGTCKPEENLLLQVTGIVRVTAQGQPYIEAQVIQTVE